MDDFGRFMSFIKWKKFLFFKLDGKNILKDIFNFFLLSDLDVFSFITEWEDVYVKDMISRFDYFLIFRMDHGSSLV